MRRQAGGPGGPGGSNGPSIPGVSASARGAPQEDLGTDVTSLRQRLSALRQSAQRPEADLRPTLDAVLAELDLALAMMGKKRHPAVPEADRTEDADAERRLLRAVFQEVPAPIFLLERDGTVRRINRQAATLLGIDPGSASGKLFTALVHLPDRAAVKNQLAALLRTRRSRRVRCKLLGDGGPVDTTVTIDLVRRAGELEPLIIAVLGPAIRPVPEPPVSKAAAAGVTSHRAIAAATQRFDLMSAASRLLLENAAFSESVMLRRCATLLASEFTAWVLVDVEQGGKLRRIFVAAPAGEQFADLTQSIEDRSPQLGSLPWEVHHTGRPKLLAGGADAGALGSGSTGLPVLQMLGASTVMCVPLTGGERSYGTVTLARRPDAGALTMADLELVQDIARHAAVALKVGRMFLRRSAVTEALQASLLPRDLPQIPGVEITGEYMAATEDLGVGGDFYDAFPSPGGWGVAIGDVCGKGEEAAAVTAMVRHAIRVFAHWNADPAEVLRLTNEVMCSQPGREQFVTAIAARLAWRGGGLRVVLACTGHPAPLIVRPDGRVRTTAGGGLPLGFFDDPRVSTETADLEPGDLLLLHSDGVAEARAADGSYFGGRLADELAGLAGRPARHVVSIIRDRVLEFTGGYLRDDMSLLAVRAVDPPDEMPASGGHHGILAGSHPQRRAS